MAEGAFTKQRMNVTITITKRTQQKQTRQESMKYQVNSYIKLIQTIPS